MSHLLFILVCGFWGTSFVLMAEGLAVYSPVGVAAWRVATGAVALAALWFAQRRRWPMTWRDLAPLLAITVVAYVAPYVLQPYLIEVIDRHSGHGSSFGGLMVSLVPLMTIVASVPLLGIWPTRRQLLGVLGGLVAMGWLFADEFAEGVAVSDLALAAITPLTYGVANTYIKRRFNNVPATALVLATLTLSSLLLVPAAVAEARWWPDPEPVTGAQVLRAAAALTLLGVVCTGVATFFFYKLVQREGPLFAGMVTYIIPTVALLWGWAIGESISTAQVGALALVFAMVALTQWGAPRRRPMVMEPP